MQQFGYHELSNQFFALAFDNLKFITVEDIETTNVYCDYSIERLINIIFQKLISNNIYLKNFEMAEKFIEKY